MSYGDTGIDRSEARSIAQDVVSSERYERERAIEGVRYDAAAERDSRRSEDEGIRERLHEVQSELDSVRAALLEEIATLRARVEALEP